MKNSLYLNIRNKAEQNRRTGATPKKPTAEMLRQERKIKAQKADGGPIGDDDKLKPKYVAERSTTATKNTPEMSTKEWQEGPRSFGPTLNDLDVVTDVMQFGNFVPHPLGQAIGKVGNWGGAAIDSYQAAEAYDEGNYSDMAINIASAGLGAYLGAKGRGYTRDMYNTVPGSVADKIANLGSRSGSYRPLTAYPHLKNNPVIQRGLNYNRGILGGIGAETIYDNKADGGYLYAEGGDDINPGKQKAVASTTAVNTRALPEGLFEQVKLNPPARQPEIINIVDKRKWNPVTNKPINPNRDLVGGKFEDSIINNIINSASKNGVDPYIALAIGLQESRLGTTDPNVGHIMVDPYSDYMPGVEDMVLKIKEKQDYAKKLGYNDQLHQIQAYNGLGVLSKKKGEVNNSAYGVAIPEEGLDLRKNPLYGKKIINIVDSVLKPNPEVAERVKYYNSKMDGGPINPYMYYAGGPMQYEVGGKVWQSIGSGAYGVLKGTLGTVTGGLTNPLMDMGEDALQKLANPNFDPTNPDDVKAMRQINTAGGAGEIGGAVLGGIVSGNVGSAVAQGASGVDDIIQSSTASDSTKQWSKGLSTIAQFGHMMNGAGATTASGAGAGATEGASASTSNFKNIMTNFSGTKFGKSAGKAMPFVNQAAGMLGDKQGSLLEQGYAMQEYLNSPEYLAMKEQQNQAYVNQGLSFAANGGPVNNNLLTLQTDSMRNRYKTYKTKYSRGGKVQDNAEEKLEYFGMTKVPNHSGFHYENPNGGSYGGENASFEKNEIVLHAKGGPTPGPGKFVFPSEVNGQQNRPAFLEVDKNGIPKPLNKTIAKFVEDEATKGSPFRKHNNLGEERVDAANQKAMEMVAYYDQLDQQQEQERQAMVEGALQYAAAGGKLNEDISKIVKEEYAAAYGGRINPKKYSGLNMPGSYAKGGSIHIKESKKGTFTAAAKKRGKSVQEFARQVLANKGNYSAAMVKKANFAKNAAGWKHAVGGPLYGNTDSEYTYAHGGPVVSNVNQGFGLYAQNRGGMMMAQGGMMQQQGGQDQMIQLIQAYAQATGVSPEEIIQQLQQMEPQAQQQAIQQMAQELQGGQQQGMARGGNMYAVGGGPGDELDPEQLKAQGYVEYEKYFYNPTTGQYVDKPSENKFIDEYYEKNLENYLGDPSMKFSSETVKPIEGRIGYPQLPLKASYIDKEGYPRFYGDPANNPMVDLQLYDNYMTRYKPIQPQLEQQYPILDREGNVQTTPRVFNTIGLGNIADSSSFSEIYEPIRITRDKVRRAYQNKSPYLDDIVDEPAKPNKSNTYLRNLNTPNFVDNQGNTSSILSRRNKNKSTPVQPIEGIQPKNLQQLSTNNTTPGIVGNVQQMPGLSDYASTSLGEFSEQFTPEDVQYSSYLDKNKPVPMNGPAVSEDVKLTPEETAALQYQQKYSQPGQFTADLINNQSNKTGLTNLYNNTPTTIVQPSQSDVTPTVFPQTGTSSTQTKQSNQPNQGLTGLDYASMIGQAAAGFHQLGLGLKGGDPVNYERVTGQKIDPTVAIALAAEEGRRAQDSAAYLMRQSAPTSGSYMNNLRNLSLQSGKQRGALAGGLRYQADLSNTQMQNELNKVNAGISMQEQIARQQEQDAARTNVTEGLSGIGSSTANMIRDYRTNQINQMIAKNIGTNNYKYDPINQTITYRTQNGEMVTVPAQTVVGTNPVNIATGQMQQPKASYQSSTTTPKSNAPVVPYSGPMANYLNKNKLPDWKGYELVDSFPVTGLDLNTGNYVEANPSVPDLDKTDTEGIKAFQDWMDKFYPNWLDNGKSLNKGKGYGNLGDQTQNAWYYNGNTFLGAAPSNTKPPVNQLYDDPTLRTLFENI